MSPPRIGASEPFPVQSSAGEHTIHPPSHCVKISEKNTQALWRSDRFVFRYDPQRKSLRDFDFGLVHFWQCIKDGLTLKSLPTDIKNICQPTLTFLPTDINFFVNQQLLWSADSEPDRQF
jgi:hypothetical protein